MTDAKALSAPIQHDPFELFELEDDEQVLAELQGRVVEKLTYSFDQDGKKITGLSKAGVEWACREFAKRKEIIRIIPGTIQIVQDPTDPDYIVVIVMAQRFALEENGREVALDTAPGSKRQWVKQEIKEYKDGQVVGRKAVPDRFYLEKAVAKAARNAKRALLPEEFVKAMLERVAEVAKGGTKPAAKKAAPAAQAPAGTAQKPPEAHKTEDKASDPASAARQKLMAVFSAVEKDREKWKPILKSLTGKEKTHDLDGPTMAKLTSAMRGVAEGVNEIVRQGESAFIRSKVDSTVVFGEAPATEGEELIDPETGQKVLPF